METKSKHSNSMFYSNTASSLNKRPLGEIADEDDKKRGKKPKKAQIKKNFMNVQSKLDTGVKKTVVATAGQHQSDGLTAKRKDELFGRLSGQDLAKFLSSKYNQTTFL